MRVELLYFDGCPNHERLLPRLRELVSEADPAARIELRRVESPEEAEREQFLGSPSVRIDGRDVDAAAAQRHDFGLKCRLYRTDSGLAGLPPEKWIQKALASAR